MNPGTARPGTFEAETQSGGTNGAPLVPGTPWDWVEADPAALAVDPAGPAEAMRLVEERGARAQLCVLRGDRLLIDRAVGCRPRRAVLDLLGQQDPRRGAGPPARRAGRAAPRRPGRGALAGVRPCRQVRHHRRVHAYLTNRLTDRTADKAHHVAVADSRRLVGGATDR
jgi:hypothetical protein